MNERVALYVRVSTQEQAQEGYSIGEQSLRLKSYSEAHGWNVVKVYTDAGYSGANMDRPALQDLISDVTAGRIDKVVVYKLDRLSRSQKDTLHIIEDILLAHNCDFESMSERFDTSTAFGKAMIGILAVFAQLEREQIKERMSMGMDARIQSGKWKGGNNVPFGYRYDSGSGKLVINDFEALVVKDIFDLFISGRNTRYISNHMTESGRTFRSGHTDARSIRYILLNKTYCGYQKRKNQWIKGLHDPIIDEDTFEKAQELLKEKKEKFEQSGMQISTASTCLGGLIHCARCGARYGLYKTGTVKYGQHTYYACYSRSKKNAAMIKDPSCSNKIYKVEDLDRMIFEQIRKLAIDPEYLKSVKHSTEKDDTAHQIQTIEGQIRSISNQISRIMDLYSLGRFSMEELDEKAAPLVDQRSRLKKDLMSLQEKSSQITDDQVMDLVQSFGEALAQGDLQQKRSIISALINRIDIDGDDITIHWNFT